MRAAKEDLLYAKQTRQIVNCRKTIRAIADELEQLTDYITGFGCAVVEIY